MNYSIKHPENLGGMNDRIRRLRQQNFDTPTTLSIERALIETAFYKEHYGTMPTPVLRARNFYEICKKKTIFIGPDELIVGERGPKPKAVPTFPELTCHSVEDLHTLNERELQRYTISQEDIDTYEREVIPYWKGKTQSASSTTYRRSGKRPTTQVCSPSSWSSVPPAIRPWTARCTTRDCST